MLRAVVFDMDGVIVDSEPLHVEAEKQTFALFGIDVVEDELRKYMGRTSRILLEDFIERYQLDTTLEDLYSVHKMNLLRLYNDDVEVIPGVIRLIEELQSADVDLALASSSDHDLITSVLEKFQLAPFFKVVVSGEEMDRAKPHPDIFLETSRRLDIPPEMSIVIEDSNAGVRAAKAAGMVCIGFRSPHSHGQDLNEADLIVDDLKEIGYERLVGLMDGVDPAG
ncbi:MAG: HAD family phosphatase [bacterium]